MKKIMNLFVLVAAVAMALSSCQKNEIENPANQNYEYTFLIGNADASDEVDSKAVVGENSVEWSTGDRMGVYTKVSAGTVSNNAYGDIVPGSPAFMKVYSSQALSAGDYIYAYYPYDTANKNGSLEITMTIPAEQDGKDDMPMAALPYCVESALSSGQNDAPAGKIRFANLGAVIEFKIYTDEAGYASEKVRSVTFEADKAVAGSFTFDLENVDYSDAATLQIASSELSENTIVASADDAAVGTSENPLLVRMVVAPGSYTGQVVVETDAALYTFPVASAKEFPRSAVKPLGLRLRAEVRSEKPEAPADVWTLVTSVDNMPDGEYVIISEYNSCDDYAALPSATNASSSPAYSTQEIFDPNNATVSPASVPADIRWHFTRGTDGKWTIMNAEGSYLYHTDSNSGLRIGKTSMTWNVIVNGASFSLLSTATKPRAVGIYDAKDWRSYDSVDHDNYKGSGVLYFYYHGTITAKPGVAVSDVTGVSARGVENAELAYSLVNPDENSVSAEPDGTVVTAASVQEGMIVYTVSPNKTASARDGRITITYGEVVKVVNVAQLAPVFTATQAEILLEADADADKSFTVTSDFDWNAVLSEGAGFTISKESYEWEEGGKQSVTVTATAANTDEGIKNLGTVTFTSEAGAELVVTVKQETSYVPEGAGDELLTFYERYATNTILTNETVSATNFTVAFDKNTGTAPQYYTNGTSVRAYAKNSFTVSSDKTITKIELIFGDADGSNSITANYGTYSSGIWTGSESSVVFTIGGDSGNRRIAGIRVWYVGSTSGGETPGEGEGGETTDPEIPGTGVSKTASIIFGSFGVKINAASVTGTDSENNTWTITTAGTTSFTSSNAYYQVGSSNKPATSITFTTTLPATASISGISAKFGGFSGTDGTVTLKVGETAIGTGELNETNDVTVNSTSTAIGNKVTVTITRISKGVKCYNISVNYTE